MQTLKLIDFFAWIGWIKKWLLEASKVMQSLNKDFPIIETLAYSDIKPESCLIYPHLWKEETNINLWDITKIDIKTLKDFDIFIGWFPCQSYSMVGKRLWLADERGQLIYNIFDILEEKRPKYVFLENVYWITTIDNWNTLKMILQKFNELGYEIDYNMLNSKDYWTAQSRKRVYFFAIKKDNKDSETEKQLYQNIFKNLKSLLQEQCWKKKLTISDIIEEHENDYVKYFENEILNERQSKMVLLRDSFCWTLKGIDEISNWVVKMYGKVTGQSTKLVYNTQTNTYLNANEVKALYSSFNKEKKELKALKEIIKKEHLNNTLKKEKLDEFFNAIEIPTHLSIRMFTAKELWRLQWFDDEFIDILIKKEYNLSHQQLSSLIGDSVSVPVIKTIWENIFTLLYENNLL